MYVGRYLRYVKTEKISYKNTNTQVYSYTDSSKHPVIFTCENFTFNFPLYLTKCEVFFSVIYLVLK